MSDIVERFERAVAANGYRTRDDLTEEEYESAKLALRQLLSEAEKREKEARAKALEEAAQVAETFKRRRLGRDLSKAYFDPCGRWEGGEIHEEGKERDLIASRIRAISHVPLTEPELVDALSALQSEER